MQKPWFQKDKSLRLKELLVYGSIYLVLALINMRVKLFLTPAWFDGTLERNHFLLLAFQYTNNEQSRLLQFFIPEAFRRLLGLSVPHAYIVQWWLFILLTFLCFHFYLRKWFDSRLAFAGVLFLASITPLAYFNHLQQSGPFLLLTFLLALWAIRDHHVLWYTLILAVGALNNETMLALAAVFLFYSFSKLEGKHLIELGAKTIATSLPALLLVGITRYLTRDRPHLGGAWHWPDNVQGIWAAVSTFTPLDYWKAIYLYIFFIFGAFWLFALLKYSEKPLFLRRAALVIPLFVLAHLLTGISNEVRQMLPLSFIIIPMALFYLFPVSQQKREIAAQEVTTSSDFPDLLQGAVGAKHGLSFGTVLLAGVIVIIAIGLAIGARTLARYSEHQLASEPLRPTINLLRSEAVPEAGLICREIEVCGRISIYVPKLDTYWLPSPIGAQAESLWEFAGQHRVLWFVEQFHESGHDLSVERWLSERYGKVSQEWVDGARVARFLNTSFPEPNAVDAQFGDQILLSSYALRQKGRYLNVLLVWENSEEIDVAYKPFIHILDESGEIVAQSDQYPVGDFVPPTEWQPGNLVYDLHGLILPAEASGKYRARIGWYDPTTGERLRIQKPLELQGAEFLDIEVGGLLGEN